MSDVLKEIAALKRRVARLEAQDKFEFDPWTAWTPELQGSTTSGVFTYTQQTAFYLRIENMVLIYGRIVINAITTPAAGNLRIVGLPYPTPNTVNNPPAQFQSNANLSAGYSQIVGAFGINASRIDITETGDDVLQNYPAASLAASDQFRFSGFYRAAD